MSNETFGAYVRRHRQAAGIKQAAVADALGVSIPFVCQVEKGLRASFTPRHWRRLWETIPGITVRGLADAATASGRMIIEASALTPSQRRRVRDMLIKQAEARA